MEDEKIVELYLLRNEEALGASKEKYVRMLLGLSQALLWNREDSEECENDTYLTAWNRIPPDKPSFLGAYLSKIVRYLSLNLLRKRNAGKRPETSLVLEELEECIPSSETVESALEAGCLREVIDRFLGTLPAESRAMFLRLIKIPLPRRNLQRYKFENAGRTGCFATRFPVFERKINQYSLKGRFVLPNEESA